MVIKLLIVWIVAVVAFFSLWAILLKGIKRICVRKQKETINEEPKTKDLQDSENLSHS